MYQGENQMPTWTPKQQQAIETRTGDIVVSAAAGSGKTAVLVERICHYLLQADGDLSRLLVVTFTEAAASEMRQRIAHALHSRLELDPTNKHLDRQLVLLQRAHISTIHAFCLWLLRRYFYHIDLDPAFRVMDEGEGRLLKLEVIDQVLERHYAEAAADAPFYQLVDRYADKSGTDLEQLVLRLHEFAQSQVFPESWLRKAAQAFALDADVKVTDLPWFQVVTDSIKHELTLVKTTLESALRLAQDPAGPEHYVKPLQDDIAQVEDLCALMERGDWDQVVSSITSLKFMAARSPRVRSSSVELDEGLKARVQNLRDKAKKSLGKLRDEVFCRTTESMLAELRTLAVPMQALADLVMEFTTAYREVKQTRAVVDFSDLERYTLQLLLDPASTEDNLLPAPVALEVQAQFDEVLCDEYQDINPVQDAILSLVAGRNMPTSDSPTTFMVGDVKQSIYRFRLAEPSIFLTRCQQAAQGVGAQIALSTNFRCRKTVVDGVNFLFLALMTPGVGDVDYDDDAALVYGANYAPTHQGEHPVQLLLLERDATLLNDARKRLGVAATDDTDASSSNLAAGQDDADDTATPDSAEQDLDLNAVEREATVIARQIRAMVNEGDPPTLVWDKKLADYRPIHYRDIVVLLRATREKVRSYIDIFRQEGVPLYGETGSGFFSAVEVETMLALLNIIDNPRQDIPLSGVLRSPLFGLNAHDLAQIRLVQIEGEFYDAVVARAQQNDVLGEKLTQFLSQLEDWRSQARRHSVAELIWSIYRQTCYYDYCGGMPGGGQRQANLRALYDRARQFDQFTRHGLLRFLQYIADLQAAGDDQGTAPTLGESQDVVRLMSIHASKGLEFPVVFVAGLGTKFNQQDLRGSLLYDRQLGFGPKLVDPIKLTRAETLASMGVRESIRRAGLSEEMRILYVALTRARERLYLVGSVRAIPESVERWQQQAEAVQENKRLPLYLATKAGTYLDWIMPVLSSVENLVSISSEHEKGNGSAPGWQATVYPAEAVIRELSQPQPIPVSAAVLESNEQEQPEATSEWSPQLAAQLQQQISWRYPYAWLSAVGARTTVTELKRREAQIETTESTPNRLYTPPSFRRPNFILDTGRLTPTEVGTATHLVLQHLPLDSVVSIQTVTTCIDQLVERRFLSQREGAAVDKEALVRFFTGDVGSRMLHAAQTDREVLREVPFTLAIPVKHLGPGKQVLPTYDAVGGLNPVAAASETLDELSDEHDAVILQGVIDCLFNEPDGWVLVDFKTDRLPAQRFEATVMERYKDQLHWYATAAVRVLRLPVNAIYICMLSHNRVIAVAPPKNE
jgi:ATP-dependent helicase/nuclease subunit A